MTTFCVAFKDLSLMKKPTHYEAIRRGFNILSMVSRAPLGSKDVHDRINRIGTEVSRKTIERDL